MWQAFAVIGGLVFAVGMKVVMEMVKLREEPDRSESRGATPPLKGRPPECCSRCNSRNLRFFPMGWYYCRSCEFGGKWG